MGPAGPAGATGATGPAGPAGATGAAGTSVVGASEAPGANCTAGGVRYTSASGTAYVCNGTPGSGSVTSIAAGLGLVATANNPITTSGTLAINTGLVPMLNTNNTFSGNLTAASFNGNGSGLSNVNAAALQGLPASDLQARFGERSFQPCTWTGSQVNCRDTCTWTATGDVTCAPPGQTACGQIILGNGAVCQTGACALSCTDSTKAGWTFAESATGSRLITIPTTTAPGLSGRLFAEVRHPLIVCPYRSTPFYLPVSMYLFNGTVNTSLVIWKGTVRTNGGINSTRDFLGEALPLLGEVGVTPGQSYSLWVSAGPVAGDPTTVCYLARASADTSNVLLSYQPGRGGL